MLRSKISMSISAALLAGMVGLTGCGANNTASNNLHTKSVRGTHDGRLNVNAVRDARHFDKMEMSQKLADRVAAMSEVRSANVLLAGNTAYVAVTLDDTANVPNAKGTARYGTRSYDGFRSPMNGTMTGRESGGMYGRGMGGSAYTPGLGARGTYHPGMGAPGTGNGALGTGRNMAGTGGTGALGIDGNRTGAGMMGTGTGTGTRYDNGHYGMRSNGNVHHHHGMNGLGTTNTTTPARTTKLDGDMVTQAIKDKIAAEIKKTSPNIKAVYVSANPDFVERFNVYAEEARAGHPLKGFADEFRTMVDRIFPTRSY